MMYRALFVAVSQHQQRRELTDSRTSALAGTSIEAITGIGIQSRASRRVDSGTTTRDQTSKRRRLKRFDLVRVGRCTAMSQEPAECGFKAEDQMASKAEDHIMFRVDRMPPGLTTLGCATPYSYIVIQGC